MSEPSTPVPEDEGAAPSAVPRAPAPPERKPIPRRGLIIRVVIISLLTAGTIWAFVQPPKKDDAAKPAAPVSTSVDPR